MSSPNKCWPQPAPEVHEQFRFASLALPCVTVRMHPGKDVQFRMLAQEGNLLGQSFEGRDASGLELKGFIRAWSLHEARCQWTFWVGP